MYLEGVALPPGSVSAIELQVVPGAPKQFQVMLPAFKLQTAKQIRPRTHIVVFFRDATEDAYETSWKLWAEGEVVGYSYNKRASGAVNLVLTVEGIENYWSYTYALHFQDAKSLSGSNLHDAQVVFGTAGRVLTLDFPASDNPIPLQKTILAAIGASEDARFPELFRDLFAGIERLSPFFQAASQRLSLGRRLSFVKDDEVQALVSAKAVSSLLDRTFSGYPQDATLMSIMQALMSNVYYGYQTLVIPPFVSGRPAEFLFKPDLPFIAPPRCNAIFADQVSSFSFGRRYLSEPTRARFSLPVSGLSGGTSLIQKHYYSPPEMEAVVRQVSKNEGDGPNIDGLLMSGDGLREESREDVKGVLPMISSFESFELLTMGDDETERDQYFSQITEYNLQLAQHAPRVMQVDGPFNPMLVCGFPAVVLTSHGVIFGTIQTLSHSLHSGGNATTSVTLSHCREEDLSTLRPPRWKNARYTDRKQIDQTYADLLGVGHGSIMQAVDGVSPKLNVQFKSQTVAAQRLMEEYQASGDRAAFVRSYTKRSLTTLPDLFGFLRANRSGRDYVGGPFRDAWAASARLVARELSQLVQDAT